MTDSWGRMQLTTERTTALYSSYRRGRHLASSTRRNFGTRSLNRENSEVAYPCRVTVSIFLVNVTQEEGQVNVNPATKEDGVKHVSIVKTLTRRVIPEKRMFAPH